MHPAPVPEHHVSGLAPDATGPNKRRPIISGSGCHRPPAEKTTLYAFLSPKTKHRRQRRTSWRRSSTRSRADSRFSAPEMILMEKGAIFQTDVETSKDFALILYSAKQIRHPAPVRLWIALKLSTNPQVKSARCEDEWCASSTSRLRASSESSRARRGDAGLAPHQETFASLPLTRPC